MCEDKRFKHPFTCIVSGPSGSGKSTFCIKLLQNIKSLSTETKFDGGILWCNGESNAVPSVNIARSIQFHEGVLDDFVNAGDKPRLIILDLLNEAHADEVYRLFRKRSHHRNISVILITKSVST